MKGYPIIGGPLDGARAVQADFRGPVKRWVPPRAVGDPWRVEQLLGNDIVAVPAGKFHAYANEYARFNRGDRHKGGPTMIWLHVSMLPGGSLSSDRRGPRRLP